MASTGQSTGLAKQRAAETIVDFAPQRLKAPFLLRCAAGLVDYLLMLSVPVIWLLLTSLFSETGSVGTIGLGIWMLGALLFVANFLLMPLLWGLTVGKLLFGLRIVMRDGHDISLAAAAVRHLIGYTLTILTLGIGFIAAAFTSSGRSLHDALAGTIVIKGRKIPA